MLAYGLNFKVSPSKSKDVCRALAEVPSLSVSLLLLLLIP
eukprot:COSAG06_NODE_14008_length_1198_cov_0.914468_2_plen_39_part_01